MMRRMGWYLAELVEAIRVEGDPRPVFHVNAVLLAADDAEAAWQRALGAGRALDDDYRNPRGQRVSVRFLGVHELMEVYDEPEDGAELYYRRLVVEAQRPAVRARDELAVFRAHEPEPPVSDYSDAGIMAEGQALLAPPQPDAAGLTARAILRAGDEREQVEAVWRVAALHGSAALPALGEAARAATSPGVRRHLMCVLAGLGDHDALHELADAEIDPDARRSAFELIARVWQPGDGACEARVLRALAEEPVPIRRALIEALPEGPLLSDALRVAVADPAWTVRATVYERLIAYATPGNLPEPLAAAMLYEARPEYRQGVQHAVARRFGARPVLEALQWARQSVVLDAVAPLVDALAGDEPASRRPALRWTDAFLPDPPPALRPPDLRADELFEEATIAFRVTLELRRRLLGARLVTAGIDGDLTRLGFDSALPTRLELPGQGAGWRVEPEARAAVLERLALLWGYTVENARVLADGTLRIGFEGGRQLVTAPGAAWLAGDDEDRWRIEGGAAGLSLWRPPREPPGA